jgi:hypothetical protein
MPSPSAEDSHAATGLLRHLAARPFLLWALAFLGNALWMPYVGIRHDALLYAAQAINSYDGRFQGDLFFAYGSQSKYSLAPQLLAVAYAGFGVDWGFFLGSVASSAVLIAAFAAFFHRLLGPTEMFPLAVLWSACCPIACADGIILHVNESFLTTRPVAAALGLFAFERMLAGRWLAFVVLLAAAFALHPLLAAPVGLIGTAYALARSGRWGWVAVGVATVLGFALLVTPGLTVKLFGPMSNVWRGQVIGVMSFHHPINWTAADWQRLTVAAGASLAFARLRHGAPAATLAAAAALVAAGGVALTGFAAECEARLLFQGQPYRWVWVTEVMGGPLALVVGSHLWAAGPRARAGGLLLVLAAAGLPLTDPPVLMLAAAAAAVAGYATRRIAGWGPWPAAVVASAAALLSADVLHLCQHAIALGAEPWAQSPELEVRGMLVSEQVGPLARVGSALAIGAALQRARLPRGFAPGVLVAVGLAAQLVFWQVGRTDWARREFVTDAADTNFVEDYLARPGAAGAKKAVRLHGRGAAEVALVRPRLRRLLPALPVQRDHVQRGRGRGVLPPRPARPAVRVSVVPRRGLGGVPRRRPAPAGADTRRLRGACLRTERRSARAAARVPRVRGDQRPGLHLRFAGVAPLRPVTAFFWRRKSS